MFTKTSALSSSVTACRPKLHFWGISGARLLELIWPLQVGCILCTYVERINIRIAHRCLHLSSVDKDGTHRSNRVGRLRRVLCHALFPQRCVTAFQAGSLSDISDNGPLIGSAKPPTQPWECDNGGLLSTKEDDFSSPKRGRINNAHIASRRKYSSGNAALNEASTKTEKNGVRRNMLLLASYATSPR